jgi:hypothetical protein
MVNGAVREIRARRFHARVHRVMRDSIAFARVLRSSMKFFGALQHLRLRHNAQRATLFNWNPSGIMDYSLCKFRLGKRGTAQAE